MKRVNLRWLALATLITAAFAASAVTKNAKAQDEPHRFKEGEIKVGDRVKADPSAMNQWLNCTVTKINYWVVNPSEIDSFAIRCDAIAGMPWQRYQVPADSDHIKPGAPAAAAEKSAGEKQQNPANADTSQKQRAGNGIGTKYGTRDPQTCADTKAPARGPISAALAKKYFICQQEGARGDELYLVEDVRLEVGAARPFDPHAINMSDADTRSPIYPIRGSFTEYQCSEQGTDERFSNVGKNCNRYEEQKASGLCYRTTFGDWKCSMYDNSMSSDNKSFGVPPPGFKNPAP